MPFITSGASLRRLPLFFAYCPDRAGALQKRLKVRPEHLARWQREGDEGISEFGLGFLPPPAAVSAPAPSSSSSSSSTSQPSPTSPSPTSDPHPTPTSTAKGSQPMAGSLMVFRAPSLSAAWDRVRGDVYWTAGVWDKRRTVVREFIRHEAWHDGGAGVGAEGGKGEGQGDSQGEGEGEGEVGLS